MNIEQIVLLTSAIFGLVIFLILMAIFAFKLRKARKNVILSELPVIQPKTGHFIVVGKSVNYEAFNFLWSVSTFIVIFSIFMGISRELLTERALYAGIFTASLALLLFSLVFYTLTIGKKYIYHEDWLIEKSFWKKTKTIQLSDIVDVKQKKNTMVFIDQFGKHHKMNCLDDGFRHFSGVLFPYLDYYAGKVLLTVSYSVRPLTYYPNQNESITCDVAAHRAVKLLQSNSLLVASIKIPIDNEEVFKEDGWVNNVIYAINELTNFSISMDFICVGYSINLFERHIKIFVYLTKEDAENISEIVVEALEGNGIERSSISITVSDDQKFIQFFDLLPNAYHFEYMITSYKLEVLSQELDLTEEQDVYVRFFFQNFDFYEDAKKELPRLGLELVSSGYYDVADEIKTWNETLYHYSVIMKKKMMLSPIELNALTDNLVGILLEHHGTFGQWTLLSKEITEEFHLEQNKKLL